jgi:hypothetical protein
LPNRARRRGHGAQTLPPKPAPKLLDANAPTSRASFAISDGFRNLVAEQVGRRRAASRRQLAKRA